MPRIYLSDAQGRMLGYDVSKAVTVGRHPDNTIQLLDAGVSKFHLRFSPVVRGTVVEDLGSQNGTLLNGVAITREILHEGDELTVGETVLVYAVSKWSGDALGPAVSILPTRCQTETTVLTEIDAAVDFPPGHRFDNPEKLREAYERLRSTYELMRAVASAEDLEALGETIIDHVLEQLPADRGALLLLDESIRPLTSQNSGSATLARRSPPEPLATRDSEPLATLAPLATRVRADASVLGDIAVSRDVIERILQTRCGVLTDGLALNASSDAGMPTQGVRCAITVPLVVDDAVVGLLHFESVRRAGVFAQRDLGILATVARPAALAIANARLMSRVAEDARARLALERFLSPTLVEQVRLRSLRLGEEGQTREATILFVDIRGFMTLAEPMTAEQVVAMLNEYFERAVEVVFRHDGVLDKFIGDALMAVWGAPAPSRDHATRAIHAATDLRRVVDDLNVLRLERGEAPILVGMGLASGPVVAGLVGAPSRLEFTVVGDAVNVASRLCDMAGAGEILAATTTQHLAGDKVRCRPLGQRPIKGKNKPIEVTLIAPREAT